MAEAARRLWPHRRALLEIFLAGNLLFLAVDIWFAHAANRFREPLEWLPLGFSLAGGGALAALVVFGRGPGSRLSRVVGGTVGVLSLAIGIWGTLAHLESGFFRAHTFESLVYAAPFAAPLAYSGIGFLLLVNRARGLRSSSGSDFGWGQWVTAFAAAGFAGNFLLSLLDHEQNGFFTWTEWIPVGAAALAFSTLMVLAGRDRPDRQLVRFAAAVLAVEVLVGAFGFALHLEAGISAVSGRLFEAFVHGAPPFAPLLFCDLAALAGIGLLALPAPPAARTGAAGR